MSFIDELKNKAKQNIKTIILTESEDKRVLEAAENMDVKYIVPTNIPMIYGIIKEL